MTAPTVRIVVSGAGRSGKSVLITHLAELLRSYLDSVVVPANLPSLSARDAPRAIAHLASRGLRVEFVEVQTEQPPQLDARPRAVRIMRPIA